MKHQNEITYTERDGILYPDLCITFCFAITVSQKISANSFAKLKKSLHCSVILKPTFRLACF